MNSPHDILNYVIQNGKEADFLSALMTNKENYSISEIIDAEIELKDDNYYLNSDMYNLHMQIRDDDIVTAAMNGLYITSFISRQDNRYQIQFMVHRYPALMKKDFEEEIVREVVQYMILRTIISLHMNTCRKVDEYIRIP